MISWQEKQSRRRKESGAMRNRVCKRERKQDIRLKKDDRGASIVIVIIAMAMIGILATSILWMSYMNYQIKINDVKNKDSFYSAETVVEQIMAGVQNEASKAASSAYQEVMKNWESLGTESNRYTTFVTAYIDNLYAQLEKSGTSGRYDRDVLEKYVDSYLFADVKRADWDNGDVSTKPAKQPEIELVNNNSIFLRNIYVCYEDKANDRVSIVSTDIRIDVPKLVFTQGGTIDKLYEYVMIGNQGIEMQNNVGTVNVKGSVFAGTDAAGKGGILVNQAGKLLMEDANEVICAGDVQVKGPSAAFSVRGNTGKNGTIYAKNLKLNSATLSLDGASYVTNDLTLNGNGSRATLTGEYYGYGTSVSNGMTGEDPIDPSASSAVIINGIDSTIDMSGVKKLLLAGRAYIGQQTSEDAAVTPGTEESTAVLMGESIAVKGGQIAYLVPAECVGVNKEGVKIGQNPVGGEQAAAIRAMQDPQSEKYDETFMEVDFSRKVYRLGNRSLSDFGVTSMDYIRKVSTQYRNDTLTYYYLVMDKDNAAKYFVQYYDFNANKAAIDSYFDKYASGGIRLGDLEQGQYTILGNSLVSDALSESGVTLLTSVDQSNLPGREEGTEPEEGQTQEEVYEESKDNAQEVGDQMHRTQEEVLNMAEQIARNYRSLCYDLTTDHSSVSETDTRTVFDNIIKEADLDTYLNSKHKNSEYFVTSTGLKAYVANGDVKLSDLSGAAKIRLIIVKGNVTVDKSFEGLIIAKGKITIANGAPTIRYSKMELAEVLSATTGVEGETVTPLVFFMNGGGSLVDGAAEAEVDETGNLVIDYSEIVRYANWIKK